MITEKELKASLEAKGLKWSETMPNIVGIRSTIDLPNVFNDILVMSFKQPSLDIPLGTTKEDIYEKQVLLYAWEYDEDNKLILDGVNGPITQKAYQKYLDTVGKYRNFYYSITTDPGTYYLLNPLTKLGTAVLKPGQYKSYQLGYHKTSAHPALVQTGGPVTVFRDNDKDKFAEEAPTEESGFFGINIHRAKDSGKSIQIDKWSAGCQVFASSADHIDFIKLCKALSEHYGEKVFTYTLIKEKDLKGV